MRAEISRQDAQKIDADTRVADVEKVRADGNIECEMENGEVKKCKIGRVINDVDTLAAFSDAHPDTLYDYDIHVTVSGFDDVSMSPVGKDYVRVKAPGEMEGNTFTFRPGGDDFECDIQDGTLVCGYPRR